MLPLHRLSFLPLAADFLPRGGHLPEPRLRDPHTDTAAAGYAAVRPAGCVPPRSTGRAPHPLHEAAVPGAHGLSASVGATITPADWPDYELARMLYDAEEIDE